MVDIIDRIYDKETQRFKNISIPILFVMGFLIIFFVLSIFAGLPLMLLLSMYAAAISIVSAFHNHWILNSMTIPLTLLFTIIMISDFYQQWWLNFIYHVMVVVPSIYTLFTRNNTSFILMAFSSVFYAAWALTIKLYFDIPAYYQLFGLIFDDNVVFFGAVILCIVPTVFATLKNIWFKKKGIIIDCDGGICPL